VTSTIQRAGLDGEVASVTGRPVSGEGEVVVGEEGANAMVERRVASVASTE